MCAVITVVHDACMRSTFLPKPVLVAVLGCLTLSGCGTQNTTTDQNRAGRAVSAMPPLKTSLSDNESEMRFLTLMSRITQHCAPDASTVSGGVPKPEDPSGGEGAPTPRQGPGETAPEVPSAGGEMPLPLDGPPRAKPTPDSTGSKPAQEVPLNGTEKCSGNEHAKRVSNAFKNVRTTNYPAIREKLTDLNYPMSRIHRMPNKAGAPRARLDLRMMGSHLALEVTGTSSGVIVQAFGVPETEDVTVTEVQRKAKLDAPAP